MASIEEYIRAAAARRGIDPDIAVRVAKAEGGLKDPTRQSLVMKNGRREPSYGPFQLLVGGGDTGFPAGLGNDFMRTTGLDPRKPENAQAGIDFALDTAARKGWGQWYGAKAAGLDNFAGIGGRPNTGVVPGTMAVAGPADGPKGQEMFPRPVMGSMMASASPSPDIPPPKAAMEIAGVTKPAKGIADIFSLMALQQSQQQQPPQVPQIMGPSPEQSHALLNILKNLNGRPV